MSAICNVDHGQAIAATAADPGADAASYSSRLCDFRFRTCPLDLWPRHLLDFKVCGSEGEGAQPSADDILVVSQASPLLLKARACSSEGDDSEGSREHSWKFGAWILQCNSV